MLRRRLGQQIRKARALLAGCIPRSAANDLHDFRQAAAVAHRERMLAPNPIKALFGHAKSNDHIHVISVVFLGGVFKSTKYFGALGRITVVHQIRHFQHAAIFGLNQMKARGWINALPLTQAIHDLIHLALLVFQALAGIHIRNMHDGFQSWVEHISNRIHISA